MAGMQRRRRRRLLLSLSIFVMQELVSENKFPVGDGEYWNPNVNYTVWVEKHKPFHVGDWLVFYNQSGMADVVQVDEVGYNTCDASSTISNYSKGRSYAFELNHTGCYYFICSRGYCYSGMRLAINVEHFRLHRLRPLPVTTPPLPAAAAPTLSSPSPPQHFSSFHL